MAKSTPSVFRAALDPASSVRSAYARVPDSPRGAPKQCTRASTPASLNAGDDTIGSVRYTAIATKVDEIVFPYSTAFLANDGNIRNVAVQDQCWARLPGHLGLILDGTTFDGVNDALKGNTVSMNCWAI